MEIVYNIKDVPEEQKKYIKEVIRRKALEEMSLYMFYKNNCKCKDFLTVLLDRFPMTSKIHTMKCDACGKGGFASQEYPPAFFIPLLKQEFSIFELKDLAFGPGSERQIPFIKLYIQVAEILEKIPKKLQKKKFLELMDMAMPI